MYDACNNLKKQTSAQEVYAKTNKYTEYIYDACGRKLSEKDPEGYITTYEYYKNGLLKSIQYPGSTKKETFSYDNTGQLYEQKTDRLDGITKIYKSIHGTPYKTEYPDGTTETSSLQLYLELLVTLTDRKNRNKTRKYDKEKNMIEEQFYYKADFAYNYYKTTKLSYNYWGNVVTTETFDRMMLKINFSEMTDIPLNDKIQYTYNNIFQITQIDGPNGRRIINDYDAAGNLITVKTKVSVTYDNVKRYEYDVLNRLTSDITLVESDHLGNTTNLSKDATYTTRYKAAIKYTYGYNSNIATKTDPLGNTTNYIYDFDNRLTQIQEPNSIVTEYKYYANGNLYEEKTPIGATITYTYNTANKLSEKKETSTAGISTTSYEYDPNGNIEKETNPLGGYLTYTYDKMNRPTMVKNNAGKVVEAIKYDNCGNIVKKVDGIRYAKTNNIETAIGEEYTYDYFDNIISKKDAESGTTTYEYNLLGCLTKETNPLNNTISYEYNTDNTLKKITYPDGGTIDYTYDYQGQKLTETQQQSSTKALTTKYEYNAFGQITKITDAKNNSITTTYDANNNPITIKDKRGAITTNTYNANNRLTKKETMITATIKNYENYEYDKAGNITKKTINGNQSTAAADSQITYYEYYTNGLLKQMTTNAGEKVNYVYDAGKNPVKTTRERKTNENDISEMTYDTYNRLTKSEILVTKNDMVTLNCVTTAVDGTTKYRLATTYEYDILGNKISETDPMGNIDTANKSKYTTEYTYDNLNRLTAITKYHTETNKKTSITCTYDKAGNKTEQTDQRGNKTYFEYDNCNRLEYIKDNNKSTLTKYSYDKAGNKAEEIIYTSPQIKWTYEYDELNRLINTLNVDGIVINKKTYDANGNVLINYDGEGNTTTYSYNLANQPEKIYDGNASLRTTNTYNQLGQLTEEKDAYSYVTYYTYDPAGRIKSVKLPDGSITSYDYDNAGNKTKMTDANGNQTTYAYTDFGKLKSFTDAKGNTQTYKYEANMLTAETTDRNGNKTVYTYNNRKLLTSQKVILQGQTTATAENSITYEFDEEDQRRQMSDITGTYTYIYDNRNRLTEIKNGAATQIKYTYDNANNITKVTDAKNNETIYTYDNQNRMYTAKQGTLTTTYTYDNAGNVKNIQYPTGATVDLSYNTNNQPVTITNKNKNGAQISQYNYIYDNMGRTKTQTSQLVPCNP